MSEPIVLDRLRQQPSGQFGGRRASRRDAARAGPAVRPHGAVGSAPRRDIRRCDSGRTSICSATNESSAAGGRSPPAAGGQGSAGSRASARGRGGCDRHDSAGSPRDPRRTACNGGPAHAAPSADRTAPRSGLRSIAVVASLMPPGPLRPADQPIRARESISVLRLMPKVRQTAALVAPPSSAVITAAEFLGIDRDGTTATTTATACGSKPRLHPLLDQRPFELRQRPEDMEQEFALRRGGVHLLGERAERDATRLQVRSPWPADAAVIDQADPASRPPGNRRGG